VEIRTGKYVTVILFETRHLPPGGLILDLGTALAINAFADEIDIFIYR
jgi:hypothetical protein